MSAAGPTTGSALSVSQETERRLSGLATRDAATVEAELSGRYRIRKLLGTGGFGTVWEASDRQTHELVAIKRMPAAAATTRSYYREVAALLRIRHPHVLRIRTILHTGESRVLVLDACAGGTLRDALRERDAPPPLGAALHLLAQAFAGLAAVHAQGLIHRDIKPENLLFRTARRGLTGTLVIGDFGLTRGGVAAPAALPSRVSGTPLYLAPERAAGQATVASDLYALGVVAFELFTGRPPFLGSSAELLQAHSHRPPELSTLPPTVRELIGALLAKRPSDRPASAAEALAALPDLVAPELLRPGLSGPEPRPLPAPWGANASLSADLEGLTVTQPDLATRTSLPGLRGLELSRGGPLIAWSGDAVALLWSSGERRVTPIDDLRSAALLEDGDRLATVSREALVVWGLRPGAELAPVWRRAIPSKALPPALTALADGSLAVAENSLSASLRWLDGALGLPVGARLPLPGPCLELRGRDPGRLRARLLVDGAPQDAEINLHARRVILPAAGATTAAEA